MAQILTILRIGTEWGFRDVTGAEYGRCTDIEFVLETAQRLAQRTGAQVVFSAEAEHHIREQVSNRKQGESRPAAEAYSPGQSHNPARLAWWRRVK